MFAAAVSLITLLCAQLIYLLEELSLQKNILTGTILPEIEGLHSLKNLNLSHNQLEKEVPAVFHRLHALGEIVTMLIRDVSLPLGLFLTHIHKNCRQNHWICLSMPSLVPCRSL